MPRNEDVILATDAQDLSEALGCSPDTVENLRGMGVIASQGELWDVGPARDYLRDAAWADSLWH
ncbi:hypothetical protein GCM10027403_07210 [Arthrobacter tecti]